MSRVIRIPADGGDPKRFTPNNPAPLAGSESINFVQFNTLLSAVNTFMAFLANANLESPDRPGGPIDGGVKMAAENTFVGLCNRVDAMIADTPRWSMEQQQSLETEVKALYREHREFIAEQKSAVTIMQSPHVRFRPQLIRLPETKQWAAVYGDAASDLTSVIGVGKSPEEALRDFDDKFTGKIYEQNKKQTETVDQSGGTVFDLTPGENTPATDRKPAPKKPGRRRRKKPPATKG